MTDLSPYVVKVEGSVVQLECEAAFGFLTDKEKLYAYHVGQACWEGA